MKISGLRFETFAYKVVKLPSKKSKFFLANVALLAGLSWYGATIRIGREMLCLPYTRFFFGGPNFVWGGLTKFGGSEDKWDLRANKKLLKNWTRWCTHTDSQTDISTNMVTLWLNGPSGADLVKKMFFHDFVCPMKYFTKLSKTKTLNFGPSLKWPLGCLNHKKHSVSQGKASCLESFLTAVYSFYRRVKSQFMGQGGISGSRGVINPIIYLFCQVTQ